MAKLDNVKVVNENTVEYNGFVYGLVTGDAQVHDLAKALDNDLDITAGAFYLVTKVDSDGDITFVDDAIDNHCVTNDDNYWKLFRKSHAITTDKLSDAEGVVKIELPDGTKLEGTPSDLEKITRSMQKMQAEQGVSVEIKAEVEEASATVPEPERLQVGDYAKVIQEGHGNFGKVVKITNDNRDGQLYPYATELLDGTHGDVHSENHLVKATDAEVLEAKQALLKEGDFARVVGVEHTEDVCGPHEFEVGTVLKLHEFDSDDNTFETRHLNGEESDAPWVHRKDLEPLTKEEAEHITREAEEEKKAKAERDKWAAIGREVGEIKDGDIVLTVNYGIVEITSINDEHFRYSYDNKNGDRDRLSKDATLELIVPVEQRFDTVG